VHCRSCRRASTAVHTSDSPPPVSWTCTTVSGAAEATAVVDATNLVAVVTVVLAGVVAAALCGVAVVVGASSADASAAAATAAEPGPPQIALEA